MLWNLRDAALDPETSGTLVVVFPLGTTADSIFEAVLLADGRLVNGTWLDSAWVVHSDQPGFVKRLLTQGAWRAFEPGLFRTITVAGCFLTPTANTAGSSKD